MTKIRRGPDRLKQSLSAPKTETPPERLLKSVEVEREAGRMARVETLLRTGMANFPGKLDQYGHPLFHKELMRLMLSQGRWREAEALVQPGQGSPWHILLEARAYEAHGMLEKADEVWGRVRELWPELEEGSDWPSRRERLVAQQ